MIKNGRKNFAEKESDHLSSHEESKNSYVVKSKYEKISQNLKFMWTRVAEVAQRPKGPSPKSVNFDGNFKTYYKLFCRDIKIHGNLQCFLGKKCTITWYKVHIIPS